MLKDGKKVGEKDYGQYFQIFADTVQKYNEGKVPNRASAKTTLQNLANKYQNIAVPMSNLDILKTTKVKKTFFQ